MSEPDIRQNAGRCDVCGKPINMEDGDRLETMEFEDPDDERFTADDARDAMVRALRGGDPSTADHMVADAIEEQGTYGVHRDCLDETKIPDIPTMEDIQD